jgi:hypothetical protein
VHSSAFLNACAHLAVQPVTFEPRHSVAAWDWPAIGPLLFSLGEIGLRQSASRLFRQH